MQIQQAVHSPPPLSLLSQALYRVRLDTRDFPSAVDIPANLTAPSAAQNSLTIAESTNVAAVLSSTAALVTSLESAASAAAIAVAGPTAVAASNLLSWIVSAGNNSLIMYWLRGYVQY